MSRKLMYGSILLALLLVLAACATAPPADTGQAAEAGEEMAAEGEPRSGGTIVWAEEQEVRDSLDQDKSNHTQSRMVARHVLETLTVVDPATGEIHPGLAESWEVSEDGTIYTFHLYENVTWHDGEPLTSADVKYTFDTIIENDYPLKAYLSDVSEIRTPDDSIHSHRVHGVLIARNGKLVLEEYFHGFDRNTPHDTRSASKSVASMLVGAAIEAGFELGTDTPVYRTLLGTDADRDLRKQAMTLRHLLTMSSGFYCDDRDSDAPGNEDTLQEQQDEPTQSQTV